MRASTDRESIARGLAKVFDDTHALFAKTYRFQRDAGGPASTVLRPMLQRQCDELGLATDRIAERLRSFRLAPRPQGPSPGRPPVHQGPTWTAREMISCLVARHESVARRAEGVLRLAERAEDRATCDLLRQRIEAHKKAAWMLVEVGIVALIGELFDPSTTSS